MAGSSPAMTVSGISGCPHRLSGVPDLPVESDLRTDDIVQPFQLDPFALRGRLVRLGPTVNRILAQHDYPEPVATLLGEAITLAVLLAGALKYDGVFTLQTKGDGPVRLLVADVKTDGAVRGYAQYDTERLAEVTPHGDNPSVPDLLGAGYIAFTVDQGDDTERYQGIVSIVGATLAECAQHYFRQSEQLQAGLKLAVARAGDEGAWRAGGLMLQRVPPEGGHAPIGDDVEDAWRRVMVLMSSATPAELVAPDLPPRRLLWRLFHEEEVRVYDTHPVEARCRCSRERIAGILRSFPTDEIEDMRKDAVTTVTCEFCNTRYEFAAEELERIAAQ
jgi:molecular chaperone Hsp33